MNAMYQSDFTKEEFQTRREKVYQAIGSQAVALIQGSAKNPGQSVFRQNNDFYYLCGVETPHAYLFLDGTNQTSTGGTSCSRYGHAIDFCLYRLTH